MLSKNKENKKIGKKQVWFIMFFSLVHNVFYSIIFKKYKNKILKNKKQFLKTTKFLNCFQKSNN